MKIGNWLPGVPIGRAIQLEPLEPQKEKEMEKIEFVKDTGAYKWYNKMVEVAPGTFEQVDIHEHGNRDFTWSVSIPMSGKELASGKAVSLKQAEFLADQAIKEAHHTGGFAPRGGLL